MTWDDLNISEPMPVIPEQLQPPVPFDGTGGEQVLEELANIVAKITNLQQTVEERLSYDQTKEKAFDRLYAEVEEVRQERAFQQVRPLLIDLLLLFDRIEQCRQHISGQKTSTVSDVAQMLQTISDELLEVLYRREVEVIVATSPIFDRILQQVVSLQPTDSATTHNQVVRAVRRGFRYRNRILRPEDVIVYNYTPINGK